MNKFDKLMKLAMRPLTEEVWTLSGIEAYPAVLVPDPLPQKFVRINVIPAGTGVNLSSGSGIVRIDVFVPVTAGLAEVASVLDLLNQCYTSKQYSVDTSSIQFWALTAGETARDKDNPSLSMTSLTIPFKFFGVE
jgi:hypothetical protein